MENTYSGWVKHGETGGHGLFYPFLEYNHWIGKIMGIVYTCIYYIYRKSEFA